MKENSEIFGPKPFILSSLEAFGSPRGFRYTLATYTRPVHGITEELRTRLVNLSDEKLKEEMDKHLDLSELLQY